MTYDPQSQRRNVPPQNAWGPRQPQPQPYQGQWPPPQQPQYPPPPPRYQPPRQPPPRKRHRGLRIFALLSVLLAIVVIAVVIATSGGSGGSFKAVVADYVVINPADLAVTIHVTNTGSSAATPTCTVDAQDPSGAYSGVDVGTLASPVAAGQTTTYVDNVTITHEGAQYVTQVTVSC